MGLAKLKRNRLEELSPEEQAKIDNTLRTYLKNNGQGAWWGCNTFSFIVQNTANHYFRIPKTMIRDTLVKPEYRSKPCYVAVVICDTLVALAKNPDVKRLMAADLPVPGVTPKACQDWACVKQELADSTPNKPWGSMFIDWAGLTLATLGVAHLLGWRPFGGDDTPPPPGDGEDGTAPPPGGGGGDDVTPPPGGETGLDILCSLLPDIPLCQGKEKPPGGGEPQPGAGTEPGGSPQPQSLFLLAGLGMMGLLAVVLLTSVLQD
jgi:hypothetical protein